MFNVFLHAVPRGVPIAVSSHGTTTPEGWAEEPDDEDHDRAINTCTGQSDSQEGSGSCEVYTDTAR
ncbi:hypothetical protein EYF80_054817 [Liparis tanakae]|uniref:Uncharacterized protein n=1 Tax=Liparis tanakae TaxID=230148 RepID=A0A4Z2F1K7_9TELE|nr:hypothetical protein EYF80_054817 [Liparis tanakae]